MFFRDRWIEVDRAILREALRALEKGAGRNRDALNFALGLGHVGSLEVEDARAHGGLRGLLSDLRRRHAEAQPEGGGDSDESIPGFVGSLRDSNYAARLESMSDDKTLNSNTVGTISTLMDEIFFQRRVELWSENPRLFDLQRRGLAFNRAWNGTNHTILCTDYTTKPGSANFILWIPQAEFDGNENMDLAKDQNPAQGKGL